ncbi:unnamed protein product, partial [Tetraodon nigroviridis]
DAILCDIGEFHCRDRKTCVPEAWLCDGEPDCPDDSDETDTICSTGNCCPSATAHIKLWSDVLSTTYSASERRNVFTSTNSATGPETARTASMKEFTVEVRRFLHIPPHPPSESTSNNHCSFYYGNWC